MLHFLIFPFHLSSAITIDHCLRSILSPSVSSLIPTSPIILVCGSSSSVIYGQHSHSNSITSKMISSSTAFCGKMGRFHIPPSLSTSQQSSQPAWRRSTGGLPTPPPSPPNSRPSSQHSPQTGLDLWDQMGTARKGGLPAPMRVGARQMVLECVPGRVCLLPDLQQIPTTSVVHSRQDLGSPWSHPHVITRTWVDEDGVELVGLRTCTSFGGQGVKARKEEHRHYFLEAGESQLATTSGKFAKQTYVNCSPGHEFVIEFQHLVPWPSTSKNAIQFNDAALESINCPRGKNVDSLF
jgi:hypothetical protein